MALRTDQRRPYTTASTSTTTHTNSNNNVPGVTVRTPNGRILTLKQLKQERMTKERQTANITGLPIKTRKAANLTKKVLSLLIKSPEVKASAVKKWLNMENANNETNLVRNAVNKLVPEDRAKLEKIAENWETLTETNRNGLDEELEKINTMRNTLRRRAATAAAGTTAPVPQTAVPPSQTNASRLAGNAAKARASLAITNQVFRDLMKIAQGVMRDAAPADVEVETAALLTEEGSEIFRNLVPELADQVEILLGKWDERPESNRSRILGNLGPAPVPHTLPTTNNNMNNLTARMSRLSVRNTTNIPTVPSQALLTTNVLAASVAEPTQQNNNNFHTVLENNENNWQTAYEGEDELEIEAATESGLANYMVGTDVLDENISLVPEDRLTSLIADAGRIVNAIDAQETYDDVTGLPAESPLVILRENILGFTNNVVKFVGPASVVASELQTMVGRARAGAGTGAAEIGRIFVEAMRLLLTNLESLIPSRESLFALSNLLFQIMRQYGDRTQDALMAALIGGSNILGKLAKAKNYLVEKISSHGGTFLTSLKKVGGWSLAGVRSLFSKPKANAIIVTNTWSPPPRVDFIAAARPSLAAKRRAQFKVTPNIYRQQMKYMFGDNVSKRLAAEESAAEAKRTAEIAAAEAKRTVFFDQKQSERGKREWLRAERLADAARIQAEAAARAAAAEVARAEAAEVARAARAAAAEAAQAEAARAAEAARVERERKEAARAEAARAARTAAAEAARAEAARAAEAARVERERKEAARAAQAAEATRAEAAARREEANAKRLRKLQAEGIKWKENSEKRAAARAEAARVEREREEAARAARAAAARVEREREEAARAARAAAAEAARAEAVRAAETARAAEAARIEREREEAARAAEEAKGKSPCPPGQHIRQRNAPIVRTLREGGRSEHEIPYGLKKGDCYKPGISGGRRTKRRAHRRRRSLKH